MQSPGAHLKLIPAQHMLNSKITLSNQPSILPDWLTHISSAGTFQAKAFSKNAELLFNTFTALLLLAGKMVVGLTRK